MGCGHHKEKDSSLAGVKVFRHQRIDLIMCSQQVAFEGGHILEFYGLASTTTSTDLEAWLAKADQGRLPALVRCSAQQS